VALVTLGRTSFVLGLRPGIPTADFSFNYSEGKRAFETSSRWMPKEQGVVCGAARSGRHGSIAKRHHVIAQAHRISCSISMETVTASATLAVLAQASAARAIRVPSSSRSAVRRPELLHKKTAPARAPSLRPFLWLAINPVISRPFNQLILIESGWKY
jgi:hypothetical protein